MNGNSNTGRSRQEGTASKFCVEQDLEQVDRLIAAIDVEPNLETVDRELARIRGR